MANKNYELRFNFNTKDVEIASNSILSLKNQILILKKELGRDDLDQAQFEILSKKLNDTKDKFQATEARSRELFGTLSLLPGPVGDISRSLGGAVDLLKTFSQFKLADLKSQFGGLGRDLKDVFTSIGSLGEATDKVSDSNENLTNKTNDLTSASNANAGANVRQVSAIENLVEAQKTSTDASGQAIEAQKKYLSTLTARRDAITSTITADKSFNDLTKEQKKELATLNNQILKGNESLRQLQSSTTQSTTATQTNTAVQQGNAVAQGAAAAGAGANAAANTLLARSMTAAATAGRILKGVLISLGIGALIVLIGELISQVYNWASGTGEAEAAQKKLNQQLERTNELIDLENAAYARANAERIAALKASGASEKQIRDEQLKQRKDAYSRAFKNEQEAVRQYNAALGKADAETLEKLGDNLTKRTEDTRNALSAVRVLESENLAATRRENQEASEKAKEDREKKAAEQLAEKKAELDAQIQLEIDKGNTEGAVLEKLLQERLVLENKKGAQLELLKNQNKKRVDDALADDKKAEQDRIKNTEEFNKKIRDLKTSAILDDIQREKQARTDKYNDDLAALEIDKEFIKKSETEKADIKKTLRETYNNDLNKIDEKQQTKEREALLKGFDDRLRILELQGQGLLQGTKAYFDNRKAILDETEAKEMEQLKADLATKKLTQEQYEQAVTATQAKYGELRKQLKQQELEAVGKTISATFDALAGLTGAIASSYDEEAKTSEKAFNQRKKLQVATAVMSAASGLIQILTQPSTLPSPFDWIVKGINAAALAVATGVNISKIKKTQFEAPDSGDSGTTPYKVTANRASGGIVTGPGTATSDSIPARLSNGEFVVNARATSAYLPLLSAINDAGLQPRFAMGGLATQSSGVDTAQTISTAIAAGLTERPVKTYVVGQDMSNQQQFDRTIKSRSLL